MTNSQNLKHVRSRLCYLGISSSDSSNLISLFQKWSNDNSEEWAVTRFKSFYAHISKCILKKSGFQPIPFFKYDSKKHRYSGILGRIVSHYPGEIILQALRFYTFFQSPSETSSQLKKFYTSMTKEPPPMDRVPPLLIDKTSFILEKVFLAHSTIRNMPLLKQSDPSRYLLIQQQRIKMRASDIPLVVSDFRLSDHGRVRDVFNDIVKRTPFLKDWMSSTTRRSPYLSVVNGNWEVKSKIESETTLDDQLGLLWFNPSWLDFQQMSPYDAPVTPFLPLYEDFNMIKKGLYVNRFRPPSNSKSIPTDVVGRISFIQEPGYKLRAVANPFRALQALSFPTSETLWSMVKTFDLWGVTYVFNQDAGLEKVSRWVSEGHTTHSIDLSDATNHFPWEFQIRCLSSVLTKTEVDFLSRFSKGSWLCPDGKYRKFTCGQPLGAYFSFASFTAVHAALAIGCCPHGENPSDYIAMVGDDIVIKGSETANRYRAALVSLDIPISDSKSVTSRYGAEFLGKLITPKEIITTPKWREITENNIFSLIPSYPYLINLLAKRHQKVLRWWASLPQPLGCGMNPKGIPFFERLPGELLDMWLEQSEKKNFSSDPSAPIPFPHQMFQTIDSLIDKELSAGGKDWLQALNVFSDRKITLLKSLLPSSSFEMLRRGYLTSSDITLLTKGFPQASRLLEKVLLNGYTSFTSKPSRFKKLNQWKKWYKKYAQS